MTNKRKVHAKRVRRENSIKCQRGKGWDLQKALEKNRQRVSMAKMEFLGPGKKLRKRPAL